MEFLRSLLRDHFIPVTASVAMGMLVWECVEVGRNDAANLVNAVFGARVLKRKAAIYLAGFAVILGATFASPVFPTSGCGCTPTREPRSPVRSAFPGSRCSSAVSSWLRE
jgi:hypothetical protein